MCKDTTTLIFSIATVLISMATFSVAYSQMKIASAKTKLDLYNKRFSIYISAMEYYHAASNEPYEKIKERGNQFTKFYRESFFLFEPSDGVYETLGEILQNGAHIYAYKKYKYEIENNLTHHRLDLKTMRQSSLDAGIEFEKIYTNLKNKLRNIFNLRPSLAGNFFDEFISKRK